ncbi:MAG: arsenic-transporting ATPase [Acidimicrobiia bacterium]|nr:MAG: arsenic-transporting ATPase [Acidimicrobiia bacterium]
MRIVLVTGKGGVGKTTVAAATALASADLGHRTLVASTDPAHSLGDAFAARLGDEPTALTESLEAQQIDTQVQLERHWGTIRDQLMDVFDWGGVGGLEAEEFLVFPGMDELFALLEVNRNARSGRYDAIVVDCAPTAETLRLLSLPEVLSWYFERIMPAERRILRAARPILGRFTDIPLPEDEVFQAAQSVFAGIEQAKVLLGDPEVTTARLVVNPEKMVIDEARRTYTYLGLFSYGVDGVVVNRILPDQVSDPYFSRWREIQRAHLQTIDTAFSEVPRLRLRLFDDEMVGIDRLRLLAAELYGDRDPVFDFRAHRLFRMVEAGDEVHVEMEVPFADREDIEVFMKGAELYIEIGPYRRSLVLPDSLRQRQVAGAKLRDGVLTVRFGPSRRRRRRDSA